MLERQERYLTYAILLLHCFIAFVFSSGPVFEAADEIEHYQYVRALVKEKALPDPTKRSPEGTPAQYHQAPLYYLFLSPILIVIHDDDFSTALNTNPFFGYAFNIPSTDNKNGYLHPRSQLSPFREDGSPTARAVYLMRGISILLGGISVWLFSKATRQLWSDQPAWRLLSLSFFAFHPQVVYTFGTVSNDPLLILMTVASFWLLIRQYRVGPSLQTAIALGIALGGALLTKSSAGVLAFPVGLLLILDKRTWRYIPVTLAMTIAVAGWWYIRNWVLYDDPTGVNAMLKTWPSEAVDPSFSTLRGALSRAPYGYETFWARIHSGRIVLHEAFYTTFDVVVLLLALALAIWWLRTVIQHRTIVLDTWPMLAALAFAIIWIPALVWGASVAWSGNQGRYLLPGVAGWSVVATVAIGQWIPQRYRMPISLTLSTGLAVMALTVLFVYFLPAYRFRDVPETIGHPYPVEFGDQVALLGTDAALYKAQPGDHLNITLYWQALRQPDQDYLVFLHSVENDLVRRDSHTATGLRLASDWQAGETWAERYLVVIPEDAEPQTLLTLTTGWYDPDSGDLLPASTGTTPTIAQLAINGIPAEATPSLQYQFGEVIGLHDSAITYEETALEICLQWVAVQEMSISYQIFIHVLAEGEVLYQADRQPKNGRYPTNAWIEGEVILDCLTVATEALPDGWQIGLGLYQLEGGHRLPANDAAGNRLTNDVVLLTP